MLYVGTGVATVIRLSRVHPEDLDQAVSPGSELTYFCETYRTTTQTWRILRGLDVVVQDFFSDDEPGIPNFLGDISASCAATLISVTGNPQDTIYFNFRSALNITANFDLNGLEIECLGSAESGIETNSTTLLVAGMSYGIHF